MTAEDIFRGREIYICSSRFSLTMREEELSGRDEKDLKDFRVSVGLGTSPLAHLIAYVGGAR